MSSSSSVAIIPTATVNIIDSQSSHIASVSTPTSSLSPTFSSSVTIIPTTTVDIIDSQSYIASTSTPTSSLPPTFPTVYITIVVIILLILVTVVVLTLLVAFWIHHNTGKCIILLYNY